MYQYLVHVVRTAAFDWDLLSVRGARIRAFNSQKAVVNGQIDHGEAKEMETWYCKDEVNANALADVLARQCPGKPIYVMKLASVYQTTPGDPVVSVMSEKGLVPR